MYKSISFSTVLMLTALTSSSFASAKSYEIADTYICKNNIPPRFLWDSNSGYSGEVSLISAGLYYGQYVSQYDARAIASKYAPQTESQLLLGVNDAYAASQMHLNCIEWDSEKDHNTDQFLAWVKHNVVNGYPVAIGVYTNEYLFYGKTNPNVGDSEYDHIVTVNGVSSNHLLIDSNYYHDDIIYFSDNGLWGYAATPPYNFSYTFASFPANRNQANEKMGGIYSLPNNTKNYGIAITGVMDLHGDTLPVRIDTNVDFENPEIEKGSDKRPPCVPITLTITVSNLHPGVKYNLYRYDNLSSVPHSDFNAHADEAYESWQIQISSGTTFVMTQEVSSNEIAIYRAVKAQAP